MDMKRSPVRSRLEALLLQLLELHTSLFCCCSNHDDSGETSRQVAGHMKIVATLLLLYYLRAVASEPRLSNYTRDVPCCPAKKLGPGRILYSLSMLSILSMLSFRPQTSHRTQATARGPVTNLRGLDPRAALVRGAKAVATRANVLPIAVAVTVRGNADAEAAHTGDGLRGADDDLSDAGRGDAAHERLLPRGVEGALIQRIVVRSVNDVDGDITVCIRVVSQGVNNDGISDAR